MPGHYLNPTSVVGGKGTFCFLKIDTPRFSPLVVGNGAESDSLG